MVVFRLHYSLWYTDSEHSLREGSIFCIYVGDTEHLSTIQVLVEDTAFIDLQGTKALQQEIRFPNGLLQTAGVRFAVAQITQGLKDGLLLEPPTHNTFTVPVEADDLPHPTVASRENVQLPDKARIQLALFCGHLDQFHTPCADRTTDFGARLSRLMPDVCAA